jgi:multidrug efflux pump
MRNGFSFRLDENRGSRQHSELELTDYTDRFIKNRLRNIPGVAEMRFFGERRYAMRIWIDPDRLAARKLTVQDVETAIRQQNIELPGGRIESHEREFGVLSKTNLTTPEEFRNIIVREIEGFPVRLGEVARVTIGAQDERLATRFQGENAIAVGVIKQATANPLEVARAVHAELPRIRAEMPEGMKAWLTFDTAVFIERSIKNVFESIGEAIVLVVLVIFFFLRSPRATIIPLLTIPISLIGACAMMYLFGFSLNTLTLLAMVLAVGLVVDDAIVVLENIHRHVDDGLRGREAASKGMREIAFAVVAMTLTLSAVYLPVVFASGWVGKLFIEFALALAGAVLVSGVVALTLTPMLSSRFLSPAERHGRLYYFLERGVDRLSDRYEELLDHALQHRRIVSGFALLVALAAYPLFAGLSGELAPVEDTGALLVMGFGPEGSTLDYSTRYALELEKVMTQKPEVETTFVVAGYPDVTQIIAFSRLKPWEERDRTQAEITQQVRGELFRVPGMMLMAIDLPPIRQSGGFQPVSYVLQTAGSYADLQMQTNKLIAAANSSGIMTSVSTDLRINKPQISVTVDRDKLADVGVDVATVGRTLESLLGGRNVTRFEREGEQYEVIVRVAEEDRQTPAMLASLYVRGQSGEMVQLSNLVTVEETVAPRSLNRFNQLRASIITADLTPGHSLSDALDFLDKKAKEILPDNFSTDYSDASREFKIAGGSMYLIFMLSLAFIYLVMAAQFESFIDPFVIMLTVPLSMTGALLALLVAGGTFNIYSQVGIITLVGLITKHGILIVTFANDLRARGMEMFDAVREAARLRLRPILMTTGAMVMGGMPLALASGAGAASRQQIGLVIVGGLLVGTVLTLFVVPVVYTYLAQYRGRYVARVRP